MYEQCVYNTIPTLLAEYEFINLKYSIYDPWFVVQFYEFLVYKTAVIPNVKIFRKRKLMEIKRLRNVRS